MFIYDNNKRILNLAKNKLDFEDAHLVYNATEKVTLTSLRNDENRFMDIAIVKILETTLALVYVKRGEDIRVISFRKASREERIEYEKAKSNGLGLGEK